MRLRQIPISAWVGIFGITLAVFCALFAPLIAPHGEREVVGAVWDLWAGPSRSAPTISGRDLLSRMIYGTRTTLTVALAATVISFSLGIFLSFTAAVSRGVIDQTLSRFNDLMMSIPTLISRSWCWQSCRRTSSC